MFPCRDDDPGLDIVRNASIFSQFAFQLELRVMAREAMLGKMAESNLCRISDHNKAFESTDVAAGDWVIFYKQISRKSTPKWRGPAIILAV